MKLLYWIPNIIFWLVFGILLLIFHPLQMIGRAISKQAHARVVDAMIWSLNQALWIVGNRISYHGLDFSDIEVNEPLILVSNHQCMYDIPAISWAFRKFSPKFVSKESLGKGIPSISYNIRHGGSTTISLSNGRSAIKKIAEFGTRINESRQMAVIFPEGARARDGKLISFKGLGLLQLLRTMPTAKVIPVALHDFWKFERWVCKPVPFGTHMQLHMLEPLGRNHNDKDIIQRCEDMIRQKLEELNAQ